MLNLNEFVDGCYFELEIDNGELFIYRDGVEYTVLNSETGDVDNWSKLNLVEPEVWAEVYTDAVILYNNLVNLNESELKNWLAEFKAGAVYEII
jgi:hypothetical protein